MKKTLLFFLGCSVLLAGCSGSPITKGDDLDYLLGNPLFAEVYGDELVDRMVELTIQNDPLMEDSKKKDLVESIRVQALELAQEAVRKQREGMIGSFTPVKELAQGDVLLRNGVLYFGPNFLSYPGPELHMYLSKSNDPREVTFPDEGVVDIGVLQSPYGTQQYDVPEIPDPSIFQSLVLWDTKLERMYAFAQL